jgi:hypothetical protein
MRRISTWERIGQRAVLGKSLQDLGYDCFAVYCTALVRCFPGKGQEPDQWRVTLERAGFQPQEYTEETRHFAMMRAEHEIARQWSDYAIYRLRVRNPELFKDGGGPGSIPCADCKAWSFWKPKKAIGPLPEPRYMQLLTPEAIVIAKMPMGEGMAAYFDVPVPIVNTDDSYSWGGDEE